MADFKLRIIDAVSGSVVKTLFFSEPTLTDVISRMYVELRNPQNWPSGDGEYYAVLYRLANGNYVKEDTIPYPDFKMENGIFTPITVFP